jgi:hypothetical protein
LYDWRRRSATTTLPRWKRDVLSGDEIDRWSTLDDLLGMEALAETPVSGEGIGRLAFYGRCSTEDNQDPRTSKAWQVGEAERFVGRWGGDRRGLLRCRSVAVIAVGAASGG